MSRLSITCKEISIEPYNGMEVEIDFSGFDEDAVLEDIAKQVTASDYLRVIDLETIKEYVEYRSCKHAPNNAKRNGF